MKEAERRPKSKAISTKKLSFQQISRKKTALAVNRYDTIAVLNVKVWHQDSTSRIHNPVDSVIH